MALFLWYNQCNEMPPRVTSTGGVSHRSKPVTTPDCTPIPDSFKRCAKCGNEYPATAEFFHRDGSRLRATCKVCACAKSRTWRAENKDHARQYERTYRANNPEVRLNNNRRFRATHPEKSREYSQRYRDTDPARAREVVKRYRSAHPDRVRSNGIARSHRRRALKRGNGGAYTTDDLAAIRAAQTDKHGNLICWRCNKPINGTPHLDHWIPLDKGGSNDAGNLHYMHGKCNQSKGRKHPTEIGRLL